MEQINITELRQNLPTYLKYVREVHTLLITQHGEVVDRLVPEIDPAEAARQRLRVLQGSVIIGDVISPLDDVDWMADENNL